MTPSESSVQRLARSRAQVVQWLEEDQMRRDTFAHSGLGQFSALPWVRSIGKGSSYSIRATSRPLRPSR